MQQGWITQQLQVNLVRLVSVLKKGYCSNHLPKSLQLTHDSFHTCAVPRDSQSDKEDIFSASPSSLPPLTARKRKSSVLTPHHAHCLGKDSGGFGDGDEEIELWWGRLESSLSLWDPLAVKTVFVMFFEDLAAEYLRFWKGFCNVFSERRSFWIAMKYQ